MRKNLRFMITMLSLVFCLTATAFGQEQTGNLEGTVKDPNGAVVPNVSVTIRNLTSSTDASGTTTTGTSTGFNRTISTDNEGFFRVLQLPPGVYVVTTAATSGFGEARYENVQVTLGRTTQLEIALSAGTQTAVVNVGSSDQPVDTTSNEISTSINAQKIELLPKGVSFTSALKAVPGTRPDPIAGGFSVDGATNSENVFIIDGQEVTNYRNAGINGNNQIPFSIVQELQVKSSGFDAEFGGATGGVINVVTKGGSNDFRGEFGMQFTTSKLNGNPRPSLLRFATGTGAAFVQPTEYFNAPKAQSLSTFPQATFSGPIIKDRLWFFANYSPQIFDTTTNTTFYTNAPAATRSITGTDTYRTKQTFEYDFLRLDAQPFSKLRLTGTYLYNPIITQGVTPFGTASFGGSPNVVNFGGSIGTLIGSQVNNLQGGRQNSQNVTGQAIFTPFERLVTSFRYSRGFLNERGNTYALPSGNQYICAVGNTSTTTFAGGCPQGLTTASTTQNLRDVSIRTSYSGDATILFNFGGRHQFKGGYERSTIFNDVANGFSQQIFLCYGFTINALCNGYTNSRATPAPNAIGGGFLQRFGVVGKGQNLAQAVYIQDKYQPTKRLTLNLGIRTEKEDLPSYNQFPAGFNFSFGEKIAPRLGGAFDLFGNGRTKVFGSYGRFFDRLTFKLAQGSFGADFYRNDYFDILPGSGPYTNFTTAAIVGNYTDPVGGSCPTTGFVSGALSRCQTDLRVASNDPAADPFISGAIDQDAKPYQQREFTVGFEHQLNSNYVVRGRYTDKKLLNAIEDAGVADAAGSEIFITGNPGEGLHADFLSSAGYNFEFARPRRSYRAMELVVEKRLSNNYYFNVNYTLSRLYGNYSGLANTDEISTSGALNGIVRSDPGVNRSFDLPFIGFTAAGGPDDGRLASDRPHVFNAYGAYVFDWSGSKANSTELFAFQTVQSGTPQTTFISFNGATTVFTERGDLGRTERFSQTDLGLTHRYRFGRDNRFTLVGELNILNLLDQKHVVTLSNTRTNGAVALSGANNAFPIATFPQLYTNGSLDQVKLINAYVTGSLLAGLNTYLAGTPTSLNRTTSNYGQPNSFQAPRNVRFGFRLQF